MDIKINNLHWTVKAIDPDDKLMNPSENNVFMGLTMYRDQIIYLARGYSKESSRTTAIHELVHATIFSFGYHIPDKEAICDLIANHLDHIKATVDEIMKEVDLSVNDRRD